MFCGQNEPFNSANVYCLTEFDHIMHVFPLENSYYQLSKEASHKVTKSRWYNNLLRSIFINHKTPFMYIDQEDLEYYKQDPDASRGFYVSCKKGTYPCLGQYSKILLFVDKLHCGDLAFWIRQRPTCFDQKDNLLSLLDASYEVEKLVYSQHDYFKATFNRAHIEQDNREFGFRPPYYLIDLINLFCIDPSEHFIRHYQFESEKFAQRLYLIKVFKDYFEVTFRSAIVSYYSSIIKNVALLFLMTSTCTNQYLRMFSYGIFGIAMLFDIGVNLSPEKISLKGILHNSFLFFLIILIDSNEMHTFYDYAKIVSFFWIGYASFFLIMLYYRYDNFKKVLNTYKKHYEVIHILKEQGKTVLL
jgi:hypothetical protein